MDMTRMTCRRFGPISGHERALLDRCESKHGGGSQGRMYALRTVHLKPSNDIDLPEEAYQWFKDWFAKHGPHGGWQDRVPMEMRISIFTELGWAAEVAELRNIQAQQGLF